MVKDRSLAGEWVPGLLLGLLLGVRLVAPVPALWMVPDAVVLVVAVVLGYNCARRVCSRGGSPWPSVAGLAVAIVLAGAPFAFYATRVTVVGAPMLGGVGDAFMVILGWAGFSLAAGVGALVGVVRAGRPAKDSPSGEHNL